MTWRSEFHKQVLAIGPHTLTGHASEVDRGVPGHLNRCFRHHLARHPLQAFGELVDGITFGHVFEDTVSRSQLVQREGEHPPPEGRGGAGPCDNGGERRRPCFMVDGLERFT